MLQGALPIQKSRKTQNNSGETCGARCTSCEAIWEWSFEFQPKDLVTDNKGFPPEETSVMIPATVSCDVYETVLAFQMWKRRKNGSTDTTRVLTGLQVVSFYDNHYRGFLHTKKCKKGYTRSNQGQYPVLNSNHMSKPFNIKSDIVIFNSVWAFGGNGNFLPLYETIPLILSVFVLLAHSEALWCSRLN